MDKEEFCNRFSSQILRNVIDCDPKFARSQAEIAFDHWDGLDSPEDVCDDELTYWDLA